MNYFEQKETKILRATQTIGVVRAWAGRWGRLEGINWWEEGEGDIYNIFNNKELFKIYISCGLTRNFYITLKFFFF